MTTPAKPNPISFNDILREVGKSTDQRVSFQTEGVKIRPGQGVINAGAIGYPDGSPVTIPSSINSTISLGNYRNFTNVVQKTPAELVNHVWQNYQRYLRFASLTADYPTMYAPKWVGPNTLWGGEENFSEGGGIKEYAAPGELTGSAAFWNLYFDGTNSSFNNLDGGLETFSPWTTYVAFAFGWAPYFNNRVDESIRVYKRNDNGTESLVNKIRRGGWWSNTTDPTIVEYGGTGGIESLGYHVLLYHINEPVTKIKRAQQRLIANGRPSSHGALLLPGKWDVTLNQNGMPEDYVVPAPLPCVIYRDDDIYSPFRVRTTLASTTTSGAVSHPFNIRGNGRVCDSNETIFKKWRFNVTNTTYMSPISNLIEYDVEQINNTDFYLIDPRNGQLVYPDKSYPTAPKPLTGVTGNTCRKVVTMPAGSLQFLLHSRSNLNTWFPFEYYFPFARGWNPNSWAANRDITYINSTLGDVPTGLHPVELRERKVMVWGRLDDGDSNIFKLLWNDTDSYQPITWKAQAGVSGDQRLFFGQNTTSERGISILNITFTGFT